MRVQMCSDQTWRQCMCVCVCYIFFLQKEEETVEIGPLSLSHLCPTNIRWHWHMEFIFIKETEIHVVYPQIALNSTFKKSSLHPFLSIAFADIDDNYDDLSDDKTQISKILWGFLLFTFHAILHNVLMRHLGVYEWSTEKVYNGNQQWVWQLFSN